MGQIKFGNLSSNECGYLGEWVEVSGLQIKLGCLSVDLQLNCRCQPQPQLMCCANYLLDGCNFRWRMSVERS